MPHTLRNPLDPRGAPPGTTPEGQGSPNLTLLRAVARELAAAAARGDITKEDIKGFGFGFSFKNLIRGRGGSLDKIVKGLQGAFADISELQKAAGGRRNVTFGDLGVGLVGGTGTLESFGMDILAFRRRQVNEPDFADTVIATEKAAAASRNQARVERSFRKFFDVQSGGAAGNTPGQPA